MYDVQIDRGRLLGFRAGDQPLSSQFEVGTQAAKQQIPDPEYQKPHCDPKSKIHKCLLSSPNYALCRARFSPKHRLRAMAKEETFSWKSVRRTDWGGDAVRGNFAFFEQKMTL
jgi:hypothetical protein